MDLTFVSVLLILGGSSLLFTSIFNKEKGFAAAILFGVFPMILGFVMLAIGIGYFLL